MSDRRVAYFSMEIALDPGMPTYAGGLGVLAGDTVRSAADLGIPMVAVTLLYRRGYFRQRLGPSGEQITEPIEWQVERYLERSSARTSVRIEGREVAIQAWQYRVVGTGGFEVPVYFLDTDLAENSERDRSLTHYLYGGDDRYRLSQELVLGVGGARLLHALGHDGLQRFHMNEGHASLLTIQLLLEERAKRPVTATVREIVEAVREKCVFTTHTPVPAGLDQFPMSLVEEVLGADHPFFELRDVFAVDLAARILGQPSGAASLRELVKPGVRLNMTYLGLVLSDYVNGVAQSHRQVAQLLFADHRIDAITNGVHAATWATPALAGLFDRRIPGWRGDNFSLRSALSIPRPEVWEAHASAKRDLLGLIAERTGVSMAPEILTLGAARRATGYKRTDLILADRERLRGLARRAGGLQLVFAGKAHPRDDSGREIIRRIVQAGSALADTVKTVYLEDYDIELARAMVGGVDVWLNTPLPPCEASGTSGMKAAINGVPSLSVLDGWWVEGCIEGMTGWSIGDRKSLSGGAAPDPAADVESLYRTLEQVVAPLYYQERDGLIDVMRHAIALNGSFFNTQRMMQQYVLKAYFL